MLNQKSIYVMLHVAVLLMLPAQAFSTVEGYFNKKFQKDCPCKIVMFHDSYFWVPKQKFLLGMNSAFKKHGLDIVSSVLVNTEEDIKQLYFNEKSLLKRPFVEKSFLHDDVIIEKLFFDGKYVWENNNRYKVNGVLIVSPIRVHHWLAYIFTPFFIYPTLTIRLYDLTSEDIVYQLEMACVGFSKCNFQFKTIVSYLKGDLEKRLKKIKCRQ